MKLVNIGFGNTVAADKIVAIVSPDSAPIKRMVQEAKDNGTAIDATFGRKTRAVLIMDSDHIVLSAVQAETVADRIDKERNRSKWGKTGPKRTDPSGPNGPKKERNDNYDGKANS